MMLKKDYDSFESFINNLDKKKNFTISGERGPLARLNVIFKNDQRFEFRIKDANTKDTFTKFEIAFTKFPSFEVTPVYAHLRIEEIQQQFIAWIRGHINIHLEDSSQPIIVLPESPKQQVSKRQISYPKDGVWHSRIYSSWSSPGWWEQITAVAAVVAFIFGIGFYFGTMKFDYDKVATATERDKYKERADELKNSLKISRDSIIHLLTNQTSLSTLLQSKDIEIKNLRTEVMPKSNGSKSKKDLTRNPTLTSPYIFSSAFLVLNLAQDGHPCDSATRFETISAQNLGTSATFRVYPKYVYDKWSFEICNGTFKYQLIGNTESSSISLSKEQDEYIYAKIPYSKCLDKKGCLVEYRIKP